MTLIQQHEKTIEQLHNDLTKKDQERQEVKDLSQKDRILLKMKEKLVAELQKKTDDFWLKNKQLERQAQEHNQKVQETENRNAELRKQMQVLNSKFMDMSNKVNTSRLENDEADEVYELNREVKRKQEKIKELEE